MKRDTKRASFSKRARYIGIILGVFAISLAAGIGLRSTIYPLFESYVATHQYPEVSELEGKKLDFGELSKYFTVLAEKKGAAYAFEVLKRAQVRPNTDMHLLGHVVGDVLYRQQGVEGIKICTQDFRNACSHSIVVGYFLKYGEAGLPTIAQTCREAPGGSGAYTMCFHGLGHGILAAVDYDLEHAIRLCGKTGTPIYGYRESAECVGGTIMEITSGGFHNRTLWEKQSAKYSKADDPLYPCDADFMLPSYRPLCYEYLTPHLVIAAGGTLADSDIAPDVLKKAFGYCSTIIGDPVNRNACYSSFGKEFVVLVQSRDIRKIDQISVTQIQKVYTLCSYAQDKEGEGGCVTSALDSLYWGGENDPNASIAFCQAGQQDFQSMCFSHLIGAMHFFIKDPAYQRLFCQKLPKTYQAQCTTYETH